jgi:hypothetical protein
VSKNNKNDSFLLTGDLNATAGAQPVNKHIESESKQTESNSNARDPIRFCLFNELEITNIFFRHKNTHTFTWKTIGIKSVIGYIIINKKN